MSYIVRKHCKTFYQIEGGVVVFTLVLEFSTFWQETQEEVLLLLLFVNLLNIWVLRQLIQSWSLAVVVLEACVEEGKPLDRELDRLGEVVSSTRDVFRKVRLTCPSKRRKACKHFIEDATKRPDICGLIIRIAVKHLGCHDQRRSKPCLG